MATVTLTARYLNHLTSHGTRCQVFDTIVPGLAIRVSASGGWHSRAAMWLRLPPPERSESLSMPSKERLRLDYREEVTPINQAGQRDERYARRVVGPLRVHLALEVQRQLLAQEQVFGGKPPMWPQQTEEGRQRRAESCRRRGESGTEARDSMSRCMHSPSQSGRRDRAMRAALGLGSSLQNSATFLRDGHFADHSGCDMPGRPTIN
jgi:hypothetical protein